MTHSKAIIGLSVFILNSSVVHPTQTNIYKIFNYGISFLHKQIEDALKMSVKTSESKNCSDLEGLRGRMIELLEGFPCV